MVAAPTVTPSVRGLKEQGDKAYVARDFQAALERYSEALETVDDAVVLSNRSATHAQRRKFDKALADAEKALSLAPQWPRAHHRIGYALFHLGRYAEAIKAFEAGLKFGPEDASLRDALGKVLEYTEPDPDAPPPPSPKKAASPQATPPRTGAFARAAAGDTASSAPSPAGAAANAAAAGAGGGTEMSADQYREKGNSLFREGKHSSAVRAYDEAIRLNPLDSKSWANRAAAQMAMLSQFGKGMSKEAIKTNPYFSNSMSDLTQALVIDSTYIKAWARKGQLHSMVGELTQAIAAYDRGLALDPDSAECRAGRAHCEQSRA